MIAKAVTGTSTKDVDRLGRERDEEDHRGLSHVRRADPAIGHCVPACRGRRPRVRAARRAGARQRAASTARGSWGRPSSRRPCSCCCSSSPIPFCMALYFSLSNAFIGRPSHFIGLTQLHQPLGERRLPADLPERLRLHRHRRRLQARAGHLAGPAAQRAALVQAADPGRRAAAVGHPHRAVDARLVVDVQLALQRGELDRHRAGAHRSARAPTGSARSTTRWRRSSSSTSGAGCRSSPSRSWPGWSSIPKELYEAAESDGAGARWRASGTSRCRC